MKIHCKTNDIIVKITDNLILGRKSMLKQFLLDEMLSREHCVFNIRDEKKVFLRDLKSTNLTFLNGKALDPKNEYQLTDGDEIKLGHQHFIYCQEDATVPKIDPVSEIEIEQMIELGDSSDEIVLELDKKKK